MYFANLESLSEFCIAAMYWRSILSKSFACPGARLGSEISESDLIRTRSR